MKRFALLALVGLVSCRAADPESSYLPAGSQAVVTCDRDGIYMAGEGLDAHARRIGWTLKAGARVMVGHDPGLRDPVIDPFRMIQVTVESGEHEGAAGELPRSCLRPLR